MPGANFTWFLFRVLPFLGPFFTLLLRLLEICPVASLFVVRFVNLVRFMPFLFGCTLLWVFVFIFMHRFFGNETRRVCLLGLELFGVLTFENASISSKAFTMCTRLVLWDDPTRPIESRWSFNQDKHRLRFSNCTYNQKFCLSLQEHQKLENLATINSISRHPKFMWNQWWTHSNSAF